MNEELAIEIHREKIGGHLMSGEVYFTIEDDGSYCSFPSDEEIIDYELYDEDGEPLDDKIEEDPNLKEKLLRTVVKLYKRRNKSGEEDPYDDW